MKFILSILPRTLFIIGLALLITVSSADYALAALPGIGGMFAGHRPENLGVTDGQLASCPSSPNCVVSQGGDDEHSISPIAYAGDRNAAKENLTSILGVVPRTKIVEEQDNYILAESESRLMGFVDDTEFYFPEDQPVIHMRAAARLGESDLGVNRRRVEQIRLALKDLESRGGASKEYQDRP